MDPVVGGLVAAAVAWLSIIVVLMLPGRRRVHPRGIRIVGALTIALFALQVLGAPIAIWVPLVVFLGGLMVTVVIGPRGHAAAA